MTQRADFKPDDAKYSLTPSEDPGIKPWQIAVLLALAAGVVVLIVSRIWFVT